VIEVAAHAFCGKYSRRDFRFGRNDRRGRQQLHLQVVRETHLVHESLLVDRRAHESRVLNRCPDLRRDRLDELLIAGGERLPRAAIRQIHDA
jgi:hypothetical protein